jgi:general stress protein 26
MSSIECEVNGVICDVPKEIVDLILNAKLIYCCTVGSTSRLNIKPVISVNVAGKCCLTFLEEKKSILVRNVQNNPNISLTIDKSHPTNPFRNSGIMIKAIAQLSNSLEDVKECYKDLEKKYGKNVVKEFLNSNNLKIKFQKLIRVRTPPLRFVHWQGPYFKMFRCPRRSER